MSNNDPMCLGARPNFFLWRTCTTGFSDGCGSSSGRSESRTGSPVCNHGLTCSTLNLSCTWEYDFGICRWRTLPFTFRTVGAYVLRLQFLRNSARTMNRQSIGGNINSIAYTILGRDSCSFMCPDHCISSRFHRQLSLLELRYTFMQPLFYIVVITRHRRCM